MSDFNYHLFSEDPSYTLETGRRSTRRRTSDLDLFLTKVYSYFLGKGFMDILLSKLLNLITLLWVVGLVTFLACWVDYDILFSTSQFSEAIQFQGFPPLIIISTLISGLFFFWATVQLVTDMRDYWEIRQFYLYELGITDAQLATSEWREIARKIVKVPRLCVQKDQMTVLDLANRIMRKENYLIAMINKDILQLSLPIPYLRNRSVITKTIEWSLNYGLFGYVFDTKNTDGLNPMVKDPSKHSLLATALKTRFRLMGVVSLILSPFIFVFLLIYFAFQYGEELRNKPQALGARQWSSLARWKFRELNELPHVFQKRLNASYTLAEKYVSSFPDNTIAIVARFVSFMIGSVVVVLLAMGLWDDEMFKVDIMDGKSTLWFITVGGTIVAACRSLIPDENTVFEPEKTMEELVQHTHYMPTSWKNKLHTSEVLSQFTHLFEYKMVIFLIELLSVLFAPFILLFSLPQSAEKIIQFFREFTVYEEGVGDVCKFAVFPLEDHGNKKYGVESNSTKGMQTRQGKMEKSFLNFKANYPDWKPTKQGEKYLSNIENTIHASLEKSNFEKSNLDDESTTNNEPELENKSNPLFMSSFSRERQELQNSVASLNKIHRQFFRSTLAYNQNTDSKML